MKIEIILNKTIAGTDAALRKLNKAAAKLDIEIHEHGAIGKPDFYLVLGGDGSVLRAVHYVGESRIPFVSINIGSLGYLTCAGLDDLETVLQSLHDETYAISERSMLKAEAFSADGTPLAPVAFALNDVVAMRSDSGRIVGIDLAVDGIDVTTFLCDGLIVATPTGSTAYSLSAGGPIVMPDAAANIINVICPHTLTSRPLVLPDSSEIVLRISRTQSPLSFAVDGQVSTSLNTGDTVRVTTAKHKVRLVMMPGNNAFATLRHKLNWNGTLIS